MKATKGNLGTAILGHLGSVKLCMCMTIRGCTFDSVCIAQGVEGVFAGQGIGRHIGYHDCASLLPNKGVPEDLQYMACLFTVKIRW